MCISFRKQSSFHCQGNRAQNSCDWLKVIKTPLRAESLSCQWCWGTQQAQTPNTQGDVSTRGEDASSGHWIRTHLETSLLVVTGEKHMESRDAGKHTECRITALAQQWRKAKEPGSRWQYEQKPQSCLGRTESLAGCGKRAKRSLNLTSFSDY